LTVRADSILASSAFRREALSSRLGYGPEQFGLDRLDEAIRQARDLPAREIISALHSAVLEFASGTEQQDDLTAVIVKRERHARTRKEP